MSCLLSGVLPATVQKLDYAAIVARQKTCMPSCVGHAGRFQRVLRVQLHTGAEHFGNLIFRFSELLSQYHIDASKDVNRPRQDSDITWLL
jgi:hypothetical protein